VIEEISNFGEFDRKSEETLIFIRCLKVKQPSRKCS